MALLKSKEEKEQDEIQSFIDKYNLENIDGKDLVVLRKIASNLRANGLFRVSMALSFAKGEEQAKVGLLSAIVEQNWLIVRQLSLLNTKLDEIIQTGKSSK